MVIYILHSIYICIIVFIILSQCSNLPFPLHQRISSTYLYPAVAARPPSAHSNSFRNSPEKQETDDSHRNSLSYRNESRFSSNYEANQDNRYSSSNSLSMNQKQQNSIPRSCSGSPESSTWNPNEFKERKSINNYENSDSFEKSKTRKGKLSIAPKLIPQDDEETNAQKVKPSTGGKRVLCILNAGESVIFSFIDIYSVTQTI